MPRLSKHQQRKNAVIEELNGLKRRLNTLNDEIDAQDKAIESFKSVPGDDSGYKGPAVDLDTWLQECNDKQIAVKDPLPSSVFYTKIVMECLSAGAISEKDIKALVIEMCRPLGIRCTSRGTLSALGLDLNILCGVLICLGIVESTTIAATSTPSSSSSSMSTGPSTDADDSTDTKEAAQPTMSMLQQYRNALTTAVLQKRNEAIPGKTAVDNSNSAIATANDIEICNENRKEIENKLKLLSSVDDFHAIVQAERELLPSDNASALVGNLLHKWGKQVERYYQDARRALLRTGVPEKEKEKEKKPTTKQAKATAAAALFAANAANAIANANVNDNPTAITAIVTDKSAAVTTDTKDSKNGALALLSSTVSSVSGNGNGNGSGSVADAVIKMEGKMEVVTEAAVAAMDSANTSSTPSSTTVTPTPSVNGSNTVATPTTTPTHTSIASSSLTSNTSNKRIPPQKAWKLVDIDVNAKTTEHKEHDHSELLKQWMTACYEEAAAKEMEETVIRRLAAQCNIILDNHTYRHGTRFLLDGLRLTVEGLVVPHNASGSESQLRAGAHFTGNELWAKARRRFTRTHPGVSAKQGMPLTHPYHQHGGNSSEHVNYDCQALHLYNIRRAETEKTGGGNKGKGKSSGNWNDPSYTLPSGSYINPRYSLPIGWNRTDTVSRVNEKMTMDEPLYASINQVPCPLVGTAILPDMMLLTSAIAWNMISKEFQVMHAEDMDMSKDAEKSPRLSGRSNSRGSLDFGHGHSRNNSISSVSSAALLAGSGSGSGENLAGIARTSSTDDVSSTSGSTKKGERGKKAKSPKSSTNDLENMSSLPTKKRTASEAGLKLGLTVDTYTGVGAGAGINDTRKGMTRNHSSLGLGLAATELKEVEVSVAGFGPSSFDVQDAVKQLQKIGYVYTPDNKKKHTYIKIATPNTVSTGGGNSNTFQTTIVEQPQVHTQVHEPNLTLKAPSSMGIGLSQAQDEINKRDNFAMSVTAETETTVTTTVVEADPWAAFNAPYDVDDMSDEAINYRHEYGLKNIRERWMKLGQLKRERRMSLVGEGNAGSPRALSAGASPRASWSGGSRRKGGWGRARHRTNSAGTIPAVGARLSTSSAISNASTAPSSAEVPGKKRGRPSKSPGPENPESLFDTSAMLSHTAIAALVDTSEGSDKIKSNQQTTDTGAAGAAGASMDISA